MSASLLAIGLDELEQAAQFIHRTVSPTEMLSVSGTNWKPFPPPTVTSKIWLVAEGTPLTAGRPFWSTMWMAPEACSLCVVMMVRRSRD